MPRSNLGGDDPDHDLPVAEKDRLERQLRKEARKLWPRAGPKGARGF